MLYEAHTKSHRRYASGLYAFDAIPACAWLLAAREANMYIPDDE
jgi:hypothetical protein